MIRVIHPSLIASLSARKSIIRPNNKFDECRTSFRANRLLELHARHNDALTFAELNGWNGIRNSGCLLHSLPESLRQNLLNWIRIFNKITLKEFGPSEFNKFHGEVGQSLKVSANIEKHSGCLQQRDQWGMWPWDLQSQSFEWRRIVMIRPKWDTKREMVNQMRYRIKRDSKPKEMTNQMIHQTKWDSKPDWMPLWKCLPSDCSQRS